MNKQEAKAELRKHVRWDEVSLGFVDTVPLKNALEVIDQLDTEDGVPASAQHETVEDYNDPLENEEEYLPLIPHYVGEPISGMLYQGMSKMDILRDYILSGSNRFISFNSSAIEWISEHEEDFCLAVTKGYEIIDPYIVEVDNPSGETTDYFKGFPTDSFYSDEIPAVLRVDDPRDAKHFKNHSRAQALASFINGQVISYPM